MVEAFLGGLSKLMDPSVWYILVIGVSMGIFVGILPGLGTLTAIALLLPFVWKASPEVGLTLLLAIASGAMTSGCITGILLSMVGEETSVVSMIDGYPMNLKGEGARAIGAGLFSSLIGTLFSVILAFGVIQIIRPLVLMFKSPELFLLGFLGISFIAVLATGAMIKGLVSGGLGILVSLIGLHPMTAVDRFTFGSLFLYDGLNLAVTLIGLFGLTEMFDLVLEGSTSISKTKVASTKVKDVLKGGMDCLHHWNLTLRSVIIGFLTGCIPGLGTPVAQWVSYGQAKQTSKTPEQFGKGCVEGVIAPESSKSACVTSALLTTLAYGLPGSGVMALFLGGLMMVGVIPGPLLFLYQLDLVFFLILGVAFGVVIAFIICIMIAGQLSKISFISTDFLFPVIIALIYTAAFATNSIMWDLVVVLFAGWVGHHMKGFGYSRASFCLGFVLGKMLEYYFLTSYKLQGPWFFVTPLCFVLLGITIFLLTYPSLKRILRRRKEVQIRES